MTDQFYTKEHVALELYQELETKIDLNKFDFLLEPSAGKGSFFKLFPENKRIGLDLEPKYQEIIKQDYLTYIPIPDKKYITIGNPPFSIGVKFFNHSAKFSDVIAMILPRTFNRVSIQNSLNLNFHLTFNKDLPITPCCFEPKLNAKCCFQIWERKQEKRTKIIYPLTHPDFSFKNYTEYNENKQPIPPQGSDFAILAYGGNVGRLNENDLDQLRPKSWHFIKSNIDITLLKKRFNELDYTIAKSSVRQNSLGKGELINLYSQKFD
jgi:hypothetical protein